MLMSGASIVKLGNVRKLQSALQQLQPYGVDLFLRRVLRWTSPDTIDLDNSHRQAANTNELRFNKETETIKLCQGAYPGVVDAGYEGALGALLDIKNLSGIVLRENVKLGQIVMHQPEEKVAGNRGIYQFSGSSLGRDGPSKIKR
ncbi:dUTPase-like protein [Trichoderma compactum]